MKLLSSPSAEVRNTTVRALATIAEREDLQTEIVESGALALVMSIAQSATGAAAVEDCMEVLEAIASNEKFGKCFLNTDLLTQVRALINGRPDPAVQAAAAKVVSTAFMNDDVVNLIYSRESAALTQEILSWLNVDDSNVRMWACLAIGNIARSDSHCEQLVNQGVVQPLMRAVGATDAKEQHAALGALKNLSLAPTTKTPMLSEGVLPLAIHVMLETPHPALRFQALGILRNLSVGHGEVAEALSRNETLQCIVELAKSEQIAFHSEATRLLANLIRNAKDMDLVHKFADQGLEYVAKMGHSDHPRMQNEALTALVMVAASTETYRQKVLSLGGFSIAVKLSAATTTPEVTLNALTLAQLLAEIAPAGDERQQLLGTVQALASGNAHDVIKAKAADTEKLLLKIASQ
eukprot:Colp12_sorted_trinity150504_noHs@35833